MATIERRSLTASLRSVQDESRFEITGTAAAYNSDSRDLGGFTERIAPGAFKRALEQKQDVKCLFNHSADKVLGRVSSGTLVLSDSPTGLRFLCKLDKNQSLHRDLYSSIKRGDVNECSFAFAVNEGGAKVEGRGGKVIRTLTDVNLFDVSVVTNPAYPSGTSVQARSLDYALNRWSATTSMDEWKVLQKRAKEIEVEILRNAPSFEIIRNAKGELEVRGRTHAEHAAWVDARNQLAVEALGREIMRDEVQATLKMLHEEGL